MDLTMRKKNVYKLLILLLLSFPLIKHADAPTFQYADINDPEVISVANFAVDQIKRGHLYAIISAQKQVATNTIYFLVLDLVDAHVKHHHYNVEVIIPSDGSAWQIPYFSATNK
jgi:hypothetical protein